jgi:hypothetical protein
MSDAEQGEGETGAARRVQPVESATGLARALAALVADYASDPLLVYESSDNVVLQLVPGASAHRWEWSKVTSLPSWIAHSRDKTYLAYEWDAGSETGRELYAVNSRGAGAYDWRSRTWRQLDWPVERPDIYLISRLSTNLVLGEDAHGKMLTEMTLDDGRTVRIHYPGLKKNIFTRWLWVPSLHEFWAVGHVKDSIVYLHCITPDNNSYRGHILELDPETSSSPIAADLALDPCAPNSLLLVMLFTERLVCSRFHPRSNIVESIVNCRITIPFAIMSTLPDHFLVWERQLWLRFPCDPPKRWSLSSGKELPQISLCFPASFQIVQGPRSV